MASQQITNKVLMVRPLKFRKNQQTLVNNHFQSQIQQEDKKKVVERAVKEFDTLVDKLRQQGVQVFVIEDNNENDTPDSVFPNNWISFHSKGRYNIYSMFAENRRKQKELGVVQQLKKQGLELNLWKDYSSYEKQVKFLQGTGSMILDRQNKIAYAAVSQRTYIDLFLQFCKDNQYHPCSFRAYQQVGENRRQIYHTNVMMSVGKNHALVGLKCIDNEQQRNLVSNLLQKAKKQVIQLSEEQINEFAGNVLSLQGEKQELILMSTRAYKSLLSDQLQKLSKYGKIVHCDLKTIEEYGGGSVRCTIAQIF